MASVTYVEHDGTEHVVEVAPGESVMEGAVSNGIPGIDADCGGVCSCATCHVYVPPESQKNLPPQTACEEEMLEYAAGRQENSRLSCQLVVDESLSHLKVHMPESQF